MSLLCLLCCQWRCQRWRLAYLLRTAFTLCARHTSHHHKYCTFSFGIDHWCLKIKFIFHSTYALCVWTMHVNEVDATMNIFANAWGSRTCYDDAQCSMLVILRKLFWFLFRMEIDRENANSAIYVGPSHSKSLPRKPSPMHNAHFKIQANKSFSIRSECARYSVQWCYFTLKIRKMHFSISQRHGSTAQIDRQTHTFEIILFIKKSLMFRLKRFVSAFRAQLQENVEFHLQYFRRSKLFMPFCTIACADMGICVCDVFKNTRWYTWSDEMYTCAGEQSKLRSFPNKWFPVSRGVRKI